jgi:hypothetical protein
MAELLSTSSRTRTISKAEQSHPSWQRSSEVWNPNDERSNAYESTVFSDGSNRFISHGIGGGTAFKGGQAKRAQSGS